MATKIRLQRHGKKGNPYYHIVVSDARAKRDGKFIEKVGSYNPNTNPATIDLNLDRSVYWVQCGAEPTDTCRAILSYKGVLYKSHLLNGVRKGALTEAQVEEKFAKWMSEKTSKIEAKKDSLKKSKEEFTNAKIKAESEYRTAKVQAKVKAAEPVAEAAPSDSGESTSPETEETQA